MLAVSIDRGETEAVKKYVEEMKLTFPNLHDPTTGIGTIYSVRGVPTTYILGKDGKLIGAAIGPRPWDNEEVQLLVEQLLAEGEE